MLEGFEALRWPVTRRGGALLRRAGAVRAAADDFSGCALACGHDIAEEAPALLLDQAFQFFRRRT